MKLSPEFINYVVYPVLVLFIGGIGSLIVTSIVRYFNKLNLTLTRLNESIQLLILDQTKLHGEQDKEIAILKEENQVCKVIQRNHRKDIDELYKVTEEHTLAIELLKQGKEDKNG